MNKNSKILIIGYKNMIGISLIKYLKKLKYKNVFTCKYESDDLSNYVRIKDLFIEYKPEYIFLNDGKSAGISGNQKYPASLLSSNIISSSIIIPLAYKYDVKKLIYFASSCVYPKIAPQPYKPEYILTNSLEPTNESFAVGILSGMQLCKSYNLQYGTNFISVIPCNHFGPYDDFRSNYSHFIPSLIKKIHHAKINKIKRVKIWGSGKQIRDYIYIQDLVKASILVMKKNNSHSSINISHKSYTISELAIIVKKIINYKGLLYFDKTKSEGMQSKVLDNTELKKLGWKNKTNIHNAISETYLWYIKNYF